MRFSPHFDQSEFEHGAAIPTECLPIFTYLCTEILEPARAFANVPFTVTSGYRSPQSNAEAHGQPNSEHMATVDHCAADVFPVGFSVRSLFDWMRNSSFLPFHQLILEHGANGSSVIHVSINRAMPGVRSVLEGATHNESPYVQVDHVAYVPPGDQGESA